MERHEFLHLDHGMHCAMKATVQLREPQPVVGESLDTVERQKVRAIFFSLLFRVEKNCPRQIFELTRHRRMKEFARNQEKAYEYQLLSKDTGRLLNIRSTLKLDQGKVYALMVFEWTFYVKKFSCKIHRKRLDWEIFEIGDPRGLRLNMAVFEILRV